MLSPAEKSRIVQQSRAWADTCRTEDQQRQGYTPVIFPDKLAGWLQIQGPQWQQTMPQATIQEIVLLATAAIYGPQQSDPLEDTLTALQMQINVANFCDERAVERVLVYGVQLPAVAGGNNPWAAQWLGSWDTLFQMVYIVIKPAIEWIGNRVCYLVGAPLHRYVFQVSSECAALIRGHLVREHLVHGHPGRNPCKCWERWADLHIESIVRALFHCLPQHRLDNWDGTESLRGFLFHVSVRGSLRLAGPAQANVNDFRKGMLAKLAVDNHGQLLMSGSILRCCATQGCSGEISLDDRCDSCQQLSATKKTSWWLWPKDERLAVNCWRCMKCKCLYFQWSGEHTILCDVDGCPLCDAPRQARRPTVVWVECSRFDPLRHAALIPPSVQQGNPWVEFARIVQKLAALVPQNPTEVELKRVGLRLFVDRWPLVCICNAEQINVNDQEQLRRWTERIVRGLEHL